MGEVMRGYPGSEHVSVELLLSNHWYRYDATAGNVTGDTHPCAAPIAGRLIDEAMAMLAKYQRSLEYSPPDATGQVVAPIPYNADEARAVRHAAAALLHGAASLLERT